MQRSVVQSLFMSSKQSSNGSKSKTWHRRNPNNKGDSSKLRLRPTHFLCLPLGHHPELQEKVTRFHSSLLENSVDGLDPSILIKPRRLHFTLGVMSLVGQSNSESPVHTVDSALELLRSLQPQLSSLCSSAKSGTLQASLERIGAFESKQGARVLWASPRENKEGLESEEEREERIKLIRVAELVHRTFKDAGYITEDRPLKLHCTLINTSHRKPFSARPKLFSYNDVLASNALRELQAESAPEPSNRLVRVSLGTYSIPEIQLCLMGSHGPEDEYVSLGSVLFDDHVPSSTV